MRLFFAIPLPEALKDELAHFLVRTKGSGVAGSWPDPKGLHITLAFLGEMDESTVPSLMDVARRIAARHASLVLKISHLGGFPRNDSARVLWLGLENEPELQALADDLREGLRAAAVSCDDKPFKAHLTLARFRKPQDATRFGEPPGPVDFEARELVLYQSVRAPSGSRYVPLGRASLDARSR